VRKVAARSLNLVIPSKLWEKLDELEAKTGVKKEDLFARALITLVEGWRCPKCGAVVKEFE
jgi:hypothetical protein